MATTSSKISVDKNHEATLSNADGFTAFCFGGYNIRFKAPYSLERYTDVVKWDNGYLVVKAKYLHNAEPEEEYIDLKPILDGLYIDYDSFLKPIKSVRITYVDEFYGVEHTQSFEDVVDDLAQYCHKNGGALI